jgi:hypothetical protein
MDVAVMLTLQKAVGEIQLTKYMDHIFCEYGMRFRVA